MVSLSLAVAIGNGGGGAAADTTPNAFTFTDVTGAWPSDVYTSNTITVTGIDGAAAVSITGGEWSKNGGAYGSSSGTVVLNDTVTVRGTASASANTAVDVVLTIGGVSDTFTITTLSVAPPAILSTALFAVGVCKLKAGYSGDLITAVNSSASSLGIGRQQAGDFIDQTALDAHLGGSDGTLSGWPNQGSAAQSPAQATLANRPVIESGRRLLGHQPILFKGEFSPVNGGGAVLQYLENAISAAALKRNSHSVVLIGRRGSTSFKSHEFYTEEQSTGKMAVLQSLAVAGSTAYFANVNNGASAKPSTVHFPAHCDVWGYTSDATNITAYMGRRSSTATALGSDTAAEGFSIMRIGYSGSTLLNPTPWIGDLLAVLVFPTKLSSTNMSDIRTWAQARFALPANGTELVVYLGTSLGRYHADGDGDTFSSLLNTRLNAAVDTYNFSNDAETLGTFYTNRANSIVHANVLGSGDYTKRILVIEGDTNGVAAGVSAATLETTMTNLVTAAKAASPAYDKVILGTIIARTDFSAAKKTVATDVNTWIRANCTGTSTTADAYIDYASITGFDPASQDTGMYLSDGIHLGRASQILRANLAATSINALL